MPRISIEQSTNAADLLAYAGGVQGRRRFAYRSSSHRRRAMLGWLSGGSAMTATTATIAPAPLSPAEMVVLLSPNIPKGPAALKATLLYLLTTGALTIEQREQDGLFRTRIIANLRIAKPMPGLPPEALSVLGVVRRAQDAGGAIKDVVKEATRTFGGGFAKYQFIEIMPALIARGLIEKRKILFTHYFRLTPAGQQAQDKLKSDLFKCDDAARLLKRDPAQAAALAQTLGVTVLLNDRLTKQFKPLVDAIRAHGDGGGADTGGYGGDIQGADGGFHLADIGSFDLAGFEAAAADAVHSAIGAFESGFSDAGGDGGGHGGGDGGGHH
jgi:hypothetical protein